MADQFAQIAETKVKETDRQSHLIQPQPIKYDKKFCLLNTASGSPVDTEKKINTKEELYAELKKLRAKYAPFLENHAPKLKSYTERTYIKDFLLDGTEKITIPHYCGPVGDGTKIYESEFELSDFSDKAAYIRFEGADYLASVYVNDVCVGIHEGFFSPFEFEITEVAKKGKNTLKVILKNDFPYMGATRGGENGKGQERLEGDKLYAATGLGYDDPEIGWHHCPPGMGIYGKVYAEIRNKVNITDMFVRPMLAEKKAEVWIEVDNTEYVKKYLQFNLSLYGQNFKETVFEDFKYELIAPVVHVEPKKVPAEHGKNLYKILVDIKDPKIWELDSPYLYQLHATVSNEGVINDAKASTFGMRSFIQDNQSSPKGMFYLNGRAIRLRGANTMGFEQQDVLREDFDQLVDDILLAKLCNMNFWRLTQRPVQDEIYQYCDMLGFMTQTDLPLFSVMRRNKFCEGLRQIEEMAKIVRKHPCNVVVTYINEPIENYDCHIGLDHTGRGTPHRHLTRDEMETFFVTGDSVVKLNHPDCVLKHVDGDYGAPDLTGQNCMPDNHCYTLWYNTHGIPFNELYKGYWQKVLPDWYYGCGEYGIEGLDFVDLIKRRYPKEWIKEPFDVGNIVCAQAKGSHYNFFDTPDTLEGWVESTQRHQAWGTKMMTEAFRRDPRMATIAIHLFIDAWPSGWMKTIMDCERTPKPAYFEYRNALEPVMISLRSDRFTYFEGEKVSIETYVCNDTNESGKAKIVFELYDGDNMVMQSQQDADFDANTCSYIANAELIAPKVKDRNKYTLKAILIKDGKAHTYNSFDFEVFEKLPRVEKNEDIEIITGLEPGEYEIAGETVKVESTQWGWDLFHLFVSRKTGHSAVAEFKEFDFSMWYDKEKDMIMPIGPKKFTADGFTPILISEGNYNKTMVVGVKEYQGKKYVISCLDAREENPVAERFMNNIRSL